MGFPSGMVLIQLTGLNISDAEGNLAVSGTVSLIPSGVLADPTHDYVIEPYPVTTTVTDGVMIPVSILVNDQTVNPNGFTYTLRREMLFGTSKTPVVKQDSVSLASTEGASIDLSEIVPVTTFTAINSISIINTGTPGQVLENQGNQTASWQTFSGGVSSVFGRSGAVTAQSGDYSYSQITGLGSAATQSSSAFDAAGSATTAQNNAESFATSAVNTETARAQAAEATKLTTSNNLSELTATESTARGNIGAAASGANGDITSLTGLTTPIPINEGGTGKAVASGAFNALSPAKTLGDMIYASATNTNMNLSGNTSAVKNFLTQTGTGAVSAAPQWNTIAVSDLPTQLYQFSVYTYGAKGDGKISNTGATNGTATVTIGESAFNAATDVGKVIMVKNALQNQTTAGQTTSVGVITTVNSSTSVTATWNTTPTLTASGLQVLWATDDTSAFQQAIAAAYAYALLHGLGEITIPAPVGLFFAIGGVLKNTDGTNAVFNSQLTIPVNPEHNAGVTLVFNGTGDGGQTRYWNTQYPAFSGSPLVSFGNFVSATAQTNSINAVSGGFGGNPSVIGGPTGHAGYGVGTPAPLFSNTCVVFQNISILTAHSNSGWTYTAANMFGVARFHARNFTYGTVGVIELYNGNNGDFQNVTLLSGGLSIGLLMPGNGNNASNYLQNVVCNGGYTYALYATEHTVGNDVTLLYCWAGYCPVGNYGDSGSNAVSALHASWFDQLCVEACTYHVDVIGVGAAGIGPIVHAVMDTEGTIQFRDTTSGTSLNAAGGEIKFNGSPSTIGLTAGTLIRIIKEVQPRGAVTPPSFSLNTAQINTFWRDATVVASGGTNITSIQVSSLAGGASAPAMTTIYTQAAGVLPLITFRVPAGCWWVVNASSGTAPATAWTLD